MLRCKHETYIILNICDKKNHDIVRHMFRCKRCGLRYNSEIMQRMVDNTSYRRGAPTTPGVDVIDDSWYAYSEELMRKVLREGSTLTITYGGMIQ